MRIVKALILFLLVTSNVYGADDWAKRWPSDTPMQVVTPTTGNLAYWRIDGTSTPTASWNLGAFSFSANTLYATGVGTSIFNDDVAIETMTIGGGSITDSTGAISFGNENLSTTGTLGAGVGTLTSLNTSTIKTDTTTPTDLTITTGAAKTLVLGTVVYKDINIAGYLLARPASSAPGVDTFRSTGGTNTTIETLAFAVDEKVHGGFELQHDYKEGTDLTFHVHWQGIAAPTGTDNVQWRLNYIVARDGVTLAAATVFDSPDTAIDTQYRCYQTNFAVITGTNFKIGDQFMFTLTRVAAVSDDYAGDCLIETAGVHYQVDTLGSRAILTK